MSIKIGDTVGDYRVIGICGAGAVGQVFKVQHVVTQRVEAMKVLSEWTPQDSPAGHRFLREIQVQARLNHPNIAAVHNAFWWNEHLVMVMEYVEGESLAALLAAGPLDTDTALDYMDQALAGLAYAHDHDVVHRDFKPANVLITPEGKVKLTDFGLAKTLRTASLTETGDFVGTLYYTAPEQVKSAPGQDARADLYSAGVVLFEAAAGKRPFNSEQFYELMVAHATKIPPLPSESNASLPRAFDDVALRALEKNPVHRFQTAEEFRKALSEVRHAMREKPVAPAAPAPVTKKPLAAKIPRKRISIAAVAASLAVAGLLAGVVWQAQQQPPAATVTLQDPLSSETPEPAGEETPVEPSADESHSPAPEAGTVGAAPGQANPRRPKRPTPSAAKAELSEPASATRGETVAPIEPPELSVHSGASRMLRTLQPVGPAWAVALSPDGRFVAAGTGSGDVEVWNIASGERVATYEGHRKRVAGLSFSPDGRSLASASWDGSARIWNLASDGPNEIIEVGNDLTAVAFGPGGRQVALGARDKSIRIWDVARRTELQKLRNQDREPQALAFSPDGEMLASGAAENVVRVWRLSGDRKPQKLDGPGAGTSALAFSADGRQLAGAGADRVRVWDIAEGQEIRTENSPGWLHALAPSPGGRFLSLGAVADSLELKTVGDSSKPGPLPGGVKARSVALSADGKRAAAADGDGTVAVWDTGR